MGIVTIDKEIQKNLNMCKAMLLTLKPEERPTSYQNIIRKAVSDYKVRLERQVGDKVGQSENN